MPIKEHGRGLLDANRHGMHMYQAKEKKLNRLSAMYGGSNAAASMCPVLAGSVNGGGSSFVPPPSRGGAPPTSASTTHKPTTKQSLAKKASCGRDPAYTGVGGQVTAAERLAFSRVGSRSALRSAHSGWKSKEEEAGSSRRVTSADR